MKMFQKEMQQNQVYRPSERRDETYAGRVRCCPLMSEFEYTPLLRSVRQTDGQIPDRCSTLSAKDSPSIVKELQTYNQTVFDVFSFHKIKL